MTVFPDYYAILDIPTTATAAHVKSAYKKASLISHPDRVPAGPGAELRRKAATIEFQAIADAYFTLSDTSRRAAYDRLRASQGKGDTQGGNYYGAESQADAEGVFGNVFEDMLRPEVSRHFPLWSWTGAVAGAALGFIAGNLPGAAIGGFGGSRLGAVRDAKGKAVYEVFKDLGADQKAEVLKGLAAKVFGMSGLGGPATPASGR